MVGVIDGFRWSLFGISGPAFGLSVAFSVGVTLLLLVSGAFYFRKTERILADVI